jgi:hypothetical protein
MEDTIDYKINGLIGIETIKKTLVMRANSEITPFYNYINSKFLNNSILKQSNSKSHQQKYIMEKMSEKINYQMSGLTQF